MYNVRIDCNESIVYYKLHYIYFWFDALCFEMKEEKKFGKKCKKVLNIKSFMIILE